MTASEMDEKPVAAQSDHSNGHVPTSTTTTTTTTSVVNGHANGVENGSVNHHHHHQPHQHHEGPGRSALRVSTARSTKTVRFHSPPSATITASTVMSYSSSSSLFSNSSSQTKTTSTSWTTGETVVHSTVLLLILVHIWVAPFTKVEESFNLQATHDILTFGVQGVKQYDHLEFPGVVPRTFLGPLVLAAGSWPIMKIANLLSADPILPKSISGQIIVRMVLGLLTFLGWHQLSRGIRHQFGRTTSVWFMIVSAVQFHWLFYAGRTLPNTFALTIVNVAYSCWMQASSPSHSQSVTRRETERQLLRMIDCLVVATVLFRSEILLLLGPIVLLELAMVRLQLIPVIMEGLKAGVASLTLGLIIDSWFWQQPWMWAEGYVFCFNAIQGGSVAWGVSPWHTYLTSLLPKISGIAFPLGLAAVAIEQRFRRYMLPAGVFVTLYSFLGHKEWRFVIYVVPLLNLGAALTISWVSKRKTLLYRLLAWALLAGLGLNFIYSATSVLISSLNYPGGQALKRLHELELENFVAATVHIDVAAAQTGCSRFGELASSSSPYIHSHRPWTYSKDESHKHRRDYLHYTHLLTSNPDFHKHDFVIVEQIDGYAGVKLVHHRTILDTCPEALSSGSSSFSVQGLKTVWEGCSPVQIRTEGKIWIMKRYLAE